LVTGHVANIFSVAFVPGSGSESIVTAGMDGDVRLVRVERAQVPPPPEESSVRWHRRRSTPPPLAVDLLATSNDMALKIAFLPDSTSVFLVTNMDGSLRMIDLREGPGTTHTWLSMRGCLHSQRDLSCNDVAFHPLRPERMAVGAGDAVVRVFDVRRLGSGQPEEDATSPVAAFAAASVLDRTQSGSHFASSAYASGVDYASDGTIVATYSGAHAYSWRDEASGGEGTMREIGTGATRLNVCVDHAAEYRGHDNRRTFLKEIALLFDERIVATGSDCGHLFLWHRETGESAGVVKADGQVVNGVIAHPTLPVFATCGIDSDPKVFGLTADRQSARLPEAKAKAVADENVQALNNSWLAEQRLAEATQSLSGAEAIRMFAGTLPPEILEQMLGIEPFLGLGGDSSGSDEGSDDFEDDRYEDAEDEDEPMGDPLTDEEVAQLLAEVSAIRHEGNELFAANSVDAALARYTAALDAFSAICTERPHSSDALNKEVAACLRNRAACFLRKEQFSSAANDALQSLKHEDTCKGHYRLGRALIGLHLFDDALEALHEALSRAKPSEVASIQSLIDEVNSNSEG
jgi:hypothetical protein